MPLLLLGSHPSLPLPGTTSSEVVNQQLPILHCRAWLRPSFSTFPAPALYPLPNRDEDCRWTCSGYCCQCLSFLPRQEVSRTAGILPPALVVSWPWPPLTIGPLAFPFLCPCPFFSQGSSDQEGSGERCAAGEAGSRAWKTVRADLTFRRILWESSGRMGG